MMLGARTAAWSGEALPYDAEVEYLESTGTQWIDTGIIATENTRIKATLMTLSTGNKNWFGGQVMPEKADLLLTHISISYSIFSAIAIG